MEALKIDATDDTPAVVLDQIHGIFEISGRSLPEDASTFYKPVMDWLAEYSQSPDAKTAFYFKMEYFNTASSKFIQDIITKLEPIDGMRIIWCYLQDDEDMEEMGHEFSEQFHVPFEFQTY